MNEGNILHLFKLLELPPPEQATNGWLVTSCPFAAMRHARGTDSRPGFRIKMNNEGRSGYLCFSCHAHGNLTHLVQELGAERGQNLMHLAAVAEALETDIELSEFETLREEVKDEPLDPAIYAMMYPEALQVEEAVAYLQKRGISYDTTELLGLRFDPEARRIMFPVCDYGGALYGFAGRSTLPSPRIKTFTYPPLKKSRHLMGGEFMRAGFTKIVVEGQFAYAHLVNIGAHKYFDVVATMGSIMSERQAGILIEWGDPVALLYDDDAAGTAGIYGKIKPDGEYAGGGAYDLLRSEVVVTVPDFPLMAKGDPDNLTLPRLLKMVCKPCK